MYKLIKNTVYGSWEGEVQNKTFIYLGSSLFLLYYIVWLYKMNNKY